MAFLYQVLKDVSEKQPYKVGKNTLNSVSNLINNHLCSGHEGFKKLFAELPDRIAQYNKEVRESNKKVSDAINELIKYVENDGKLRSGINDLQASMVAAKPGDEDPMVYNANALVAECKKYAEIFCTDMNSAHKNIINLNKNCNVNVNYALRNITRESAVLHRCSDKAKQDMEIMRNVIAKVLENLRENSKYEIGDNVGKLVYDLKLKVANITEHMQHINEKLSLYVDELSKWMYKTESVINAADKHVEKIIGETRGGEGTMKETIKDEAQELNKISDELHTHLVGAKREIIRLTGDALADVLKLDRAVREGLKKTKDNIKGAMNTYVKKQLLEKIKNDVESIKGIGDGAGLQGIKNKAKEYAAKFRKQGDEDGLQSVVDEWIVTILKAEPVKDWLGKYVKTNNGVFRPEYRLRADGDDTSRSKTIAGVIRKELGDEIIKQAVDASSHVSEADDTIRGYVQAAQFGCDSFAQQLGTMIKGQVETGTLSLKIANAIDNAISQNPSPSKSNTDLTYAVRLTLYQLVGVAKRTGEELYSFVDDSNMSANIRAALDIVQPLEKNLKAATTDPGTTVTPISVDDNGNQRYKVDGRILGILDTEIGTETKNGRGEKISRVSNTFEHYSDIINQTKVPTLEGKQTLTGNVNGGEGSLPQKIGAIRDEGMINLEAKMHEITNAKAKEGKLYTLSDQITTSLEGLTDAIAAAAKEVNRYLSGLKGISVNHDLEKIRFNIDNLQRVNINDVIALADKFIHNDANELQSKYIMELQQFIDQQISSATSALTTLARKQYVTSVKHLLTAFGQKVTEELSPLPDLIDKDRKEGFKGFMRTLEGKMETNGDTTDVNIKLLKEVADMPSDTGENKKEAFKKLSDNFQHFFRPLHKYLLKEIKNVNDDENKKKNPQGTDPEKHYTHKLLAIYEAVNKLLEHLSDKNRYDHKVHDLLDKLNDSVSSLTPENFARRSTPVIDAITDGLQHLVKELRKVYISRYDSQICGELIKNYKQVSSLTGVVEQYDVTAEGRNCAKVCLTTFTILFNSLTEVKRNCDGEGKFKKIHISTEQTKNRVGDYLALCGYTVCHRDEQDGELQRSDKMKGNDILHNLCRNSNSVFNSKKEEDFSGRLKDIFDYLHYYYQVCHLSTTTSKKHPSSIYDMLQWLCGLTYNGVHQELTVNGFSELFDKREDNADDVMGDGLSGTYLNARSLEAHPHFINVATLTDTLGDVCHYSHDLLVAILGHGHADGRYACEFSTNTDGFVYPTDTNSLICMLRDILDRLHEQLYFLYDQCTYTSELSGWSDCYYGKDVGGSSWACNKKQCANQMCDQRANQNCDQHPNCGVKSPLQSFLEDGLQGYIPHTLTVNRGKLECAVKNHSSIPCKTPMGFTEIGAMASHTKTGEYLRYALATVCGNKSSAITKLCGQLNCLLPSAPKSLGHMFAFYYAFLTEWDGNKNMSLRKHRENAFDIAVRDANFKQYDTVLDLSDMFKTREHFKGISNKNSKPTLYHEIGDLNSLCSPEEACYISSKSCGAYAACLSADTCGWFAAKHAGLYLSWMVYLTETFYKYLCSWKEDCNANCGTTRSKCRIRGCATNVCDVKNTQYVASQKHGSVCNSILNCRLSHPALYIRGFTFGKRQNLNGYISDGQVPKRTCKTMVEQLEKICGGKSLLSQLVNVTIPEFLFKIRAPFIWLNVALWLLSLFYLLHIMVIRLDLLHIKSHLHSPSSHRIAAQSLLAAARVNKLNRVFYLQP